MADWSDGYVTEITYTHGYYHELNPLRARWALLLKGWAPPDVREACELGFGQGLSVNIHAAASTVAWWGTDFNPAQVAHAQRLAQAGGGRARLFDDSFAEFGQRDGVPMFDFIGLHGIWSWVSRRNRELIVDFVRRHLRVGGVVYASYNTLPGWAVFAPVRHLMARHAETMTAPGAGMAERIGAALAFVERVMGTQPQYAKAAPTVAGRVQRLRQQSRAYLAHEYFNQDWEPMYFADIARQMSEAKLTWAASAHLTDHVEPLNLTDAQRALLRDIPDPVHRETVRDVLVNQQFRRDYWIKGAVPLGPDERRALLRQQRVVLVVPRAQVRFKVTGTLGEADMAPNIYGPVVDALADHAVRAVEALEAAVAPAGVHFDQLVQAVTLLIATGQVHLVADHAPAVVRPGVAGLNQALVRRAFDGADGGGWLASAVTGGAVSMGRFEQMFWALARQGESDPQRWARVVCEVLFSRNERLVKDGKPLQSQEEHLRELTERAQRYATTQEPIAAALALG